MKKLLLLTLILVTGFQISRAQDFKKFQTAFILNKFEDAKTEIDKIMADPKAQAKPEGWYWKSRLYAIFYKDTVLRAKHPNALKDADESFQKYMQADPNFAVIKEKGPDGFFDMYAATYTEAIKVFNKKKWDDAAAYFQESLNYSDVIFKNKWTKSNSEFDTTSILYLGYAYQNAGKMDDAVKAYARLADNKVGGEGYADVYKFIIDHYVRSKDEDSFKKYLDIAKQLYPKDASWEEFEMEYMDRNYTLTQKTDTYDKADAAGTLNENKYLQFGDLFVNVKNKDKELDSLTLLKFTLKAADAFKKAYAKNAQNSSASFNVGVIYYNIYGEYDDKYSANIRAMQAMNANKPAPDKDPKKKAAADAKFKEQIDAIKKQNTDIEKPLFDNLDNAIDWIEKTYTILKDKTDRSKVEKSIANKSVDFLANLYAYKRDKVRGKDTKAYDAYDAKYKQYDELHGKF